MLELLITTFIFIIVTSAVLANYPLFASKVRLERDAQEIALSLRKAQSYALAVKESSAGSGVFPGYGVHFSKTSADSLIIYADIPTGPPLPEGNKLYDGDVEEVETFYIESARIEDICEGVKSSAPGNCGIETVDITYLRPDPIIDLRNGSTAYNSDVEIKIISPTGDRKTIVIWKTGQISVE